MNRLRVCVWCVCVCVCPVLCGRPPPMYPMHPSPHAPTTRRWPITHGPSAYTLCASQNASTQVTFEEMLKIMFRLASPNEIGIMLKWVEKEPEPEPEPKATLSAEAVKQIKSIFKLYDKDRNGSLTKKELKEALSKTGLDVDEMNKFIKEFDSDENGEINQEEFLKLMDSTGAFEDD